jgi:hypothetical protein
MRARGSLTALACAVVLAGCGAGGDEGSVPTEKGTEPLEVVVGEEFSWNGFRVDDGWELNPVEREAGADKMVNPEVTGTVTNEQSDARVVLWEMAFGKDGSAIAKVNCSAMELEEGQSAAFECPGFGQQMPEDYDSVVVQEIQR